MDAPRSEPRDDGRTPKYANGRGHNRHRIGSVEEAQAIRYDVDGVDVPSTMESRPNRSYLGHTSEIFPTPWPWEDRWTGNDSAFRRIPSRWSLVRRYNGTERAVLVHEINRLASIENPGRCASRRRLVDGWCASYVIPGTNYCKWHTEASHRAEAVATAARVKEDQRLASLAKRSTEGS